MPLRIDKTELTNILGYLQVYISKMQKELVPTTPDDVKIMSDLQDLVKLINTVAGKQQIAITAAKYNDADLIRMRIKRGP